MVAAMDIVSGLQATSALAIISSTQKSATATSNPSATTAASTSTQVQISTSNSAASAVGHAALVTTLQSQETSLQTQYADVFAKAKADGITTLDTMPAATLEGLQEHLSDMPNLDLAFRTASQVNQVIEDNENQSSADMSAALLSGKGVGNFVQNSQLSDLINGLQPDVAEQIKSALANNTLTIQNGFEVPGLLTGGRVRYQGPDNALPTGFSETPYGMNTDIAYGTSNGQSHWLILTGSGSAVYFSWPSRTS